MLLPVVWMAVWFASSESCPMLSSEVTLAIYSLPRISAASARAVVMPPLRP